MKTIILLTPDQYGYQTDDYYRARYFASHQETEVVVVCYDLGKQKVVEGNGIEVRYVPYAGGRVAREREVFKYLRGVIESRPVTDVLSRHFLTLPIMKAALESRGQIRWIFDIRTGSVSPNAFERFFYNSLIKTTSLFFDEVTVISQGLAKKLGIKKYRLVPLGGKQTVRKDQLPEKMTSIALLYVGIFDGRRIDDTVKAFVRFHEQHGSELQMSYDIVGYSINPETETEILSIIEQNPDCPIHFHGRVQNNDLEPYFVRSNVGISYVPMTEWYDVQPATKTFEYLVNGLVCIATNTQENQHVISLENGILIDDNEDAFFDALEELSSRIGDYNRKKIMESSQRYTWDNVLEDSFSFIF